MGDFSGGIPHVLAETRAELGGARRPKAARQQNNAGAAVLPDRLGHASPRLAIIEADEIRGERRTMLDVDDRGFAIEGDGHHGLTAGKHGHRADAVPEHLLLNRLFGLLAVQLGGEILADAVTVIFDAGLEADIEINRPLIPQIGQDHADQPGVRLAKALGLIVGHITQLIASRKDAPNLIAADVAAIVEHVGDRTLRHACDLCDVFDGCHAKPSPICCDTSL